jgi:hypothetical protein
MLEILIGLLGVIVSGIIGLLVCQPDCSTHYIRGGSIAKNNTAYILLNHLNEPRVSSIDYYKLLEKYKTTMKPTDPKFIKFVINSKLSDHDIGYDAIENPYVIDEPIDTYVMLSDLKAKIVLIRYTVPDEPTQIKFSIRFSNKDALDKWIDDNKTFVTNKAKLEVSAHIKELIRSDPFKQASRDPRMLFDFYAVHTLDQTSILTNKHWYIAPKLDGTTYAVVTYNQKMYAINKSHCEYITTIKEEKNMILLCERLSNDDFHIFDILYYGDTYYGTDAFYARYNFMNRSLKNDLVANDIPGMYLQEYCNVHPRNNTYKQCLSVVSQLRTDLNDRGIGTDGFIFQPAGSRYYKEPVFKWKSHSEVSIDLMLVDKKLFVAERGQLVPIDKFIKASTSTDVEVKMGKFDSTIPSLTIQEYVFTQNPKNKNSYTITHGRLRDDKFKPNSIAVLETIMYHLDINIGFDDINGETIFLLKSYMREFQNTTLIPRIANNTTLYDLGAGDGRMARIWKKKNLDVYAIEPDPKFFAKLKTRIPKSFQLTGEDLSVQKEVKKGLMDYVYMSYNLHFFFKDEKTLKNLILNLQYLTKKGSYVIGISLDGDKVRDQLSKDSDLLKNNKSFAITPKKISKVRSQFGQSIEITMKNKTGLVTDQTEFITDFELFNKKMEVIGFNLEQTGFVPSHETLSPANNWFASSSRYWIFKKMS